MASASPTGVVRFTYRTASGGSASYTGAATGITPSATTPIWVRLVRSGSSISGYYATTAGTPSSWTLLGTQTVTFSNTTFKGGLGVTSRNTGAMATATIDNVSP